MTLLTWRPPLVTVHGCCAVSDAAVASKERHVTTARYLTYGGLCLATCILLQKSTALAAFIGLLVAAYIGLSEYHLDSRLGA